MLRDLLRPVAHGRTHVIGSLPRRCGLGLGNISVAGHARLSGVATLLLLSQLLLLLRITLVIIH